MKRKTVQLLIVTFLAVLALKAQTPSTAFTFRPLVRPGITIGDRTFTDDTTIDSIALNDSGEIAFIARWSDPISGQERSSVFTSRQLVVHDNDTVAGKLLTGIVKDSVAINNAGQCVYEANYATGQSNAGNSLTSRGVFIDKSLVATVDPNGSGPDFTLTEDGRVIPRLVSAPAANTPPATASNSHKPGLPDGIDINSSVVGRIFNNPKSPVHIDPNSIFHPKPKPAPQPPPQPIPTAVAPPSQPPAPCALPNFPFPTEWEMGAQMIGPTTSHIFEQPTKGRGFESPYYGHLSAPYRAIQFDAGCHPLVIAIGDTSAHGRFEVYTPVGMLTYKTSAGSYQFRGFSGKVESASFLKADATLRINRKGQILIPVTLTPNGYALLLGTPSAN